MKVHIVIRLIMHILVLIGLLGLFISSIAANPMGWHLLGVLISIDLPVGSCRHVPIGVCLVWASVWASLWALVIISIALLVMDIRMLGASDGLQARFWRSVVMELLLPVSGVLSFPWWAGGPQYALTWGIWLSLLSGLAIALSALASAVVAWLLVKNSVKAAASVARVWITGAIAVVLTLIAVAMVFLVTLAGVLLANYRQTGLGGP